MHDKNGFNDPYWLTRVMVEKLGQPAQPLHNTNSRLIDFGCGTGRLGVELKKVGYANICGVDGSNEMLIVASGKDCYASSCQLLIGVEQMPEQLCYKVDVEGSGYDAALASAVMFPGFFPNTCFEEMLKTLRPGGHLIFTIRDDMLDNATDEGCNFIGKLNEL